MTDAPTIVVVGATSGLGRAVATAYAARGWRVGVCGRREDALRELAALWPDKVSVCRLDVTHPDSAALFRQFIERLGGIDILFYAAGCGWNNPMLDTANDDTTVRTNVDGFTRIVGTTFNWFATHGPLTLKKGALCAITSIAGTRGIGISATYSASKRYQTTYLDALSQLARVRGVRLTVTDIRPGFVDTALLDSATRRYPMLMSVDYAAKKIVKAVDRRRRVAYIDWRWHAIVLLWRLIPLRIWRRLKLKF